jgi:hypothetical protein
LVTLNEFSFLASSTIVLVRSANCLKREVQVLPAQSYGLCPVIDL